MIQRHRHHTREELHHRATDRAKQQRRRDAVLKFDLQREIGKERESRQNIMNVNEMNCEIVVTHSRKGKENERRDEFQEERQTDKETEREREREREFDSSKVKMI